MNQLRQISLMEFDSIVPVDDLCMAAGLIRTSQKGVLRHYEFADGRELTVNIARNEWAMKNPDCYGNASRLAEKLGLASDGDCSKAFSLVEQLYAERENIPATFAYTPISRPVWEFAETCHPNDKGLIRMMNRFGISKDIVRLYTLEGSIPQIKNGHRRERVLATPMGNEGEGFMAFDGKTFRSIGDSGITVMGQRRKDQICMVYENPLDFLALMEAVTRNGVYPLIARRYHIILNGKRGLSEACEYLKANPDFLEVRCFMPETEFGRTAFAAINDAVKGTAIDRTDMYRGASSLFGKHLPKVPEAYRKWKALHTERNMAVEEDKSRNVRQEQLKPKLDITPLLGGEKKAVIDRETGGLKL